jgi:hypothetical protein
MNDTWNTLDSDAVTLIGGFICRLSAEERNRWHELLTTGEETEAHVHYRDCEAHTMALRQVRIECGLHMTEPGRLDHNSRERVDALVALLRKARAAELEAQDRLYQIGKAWFEGIVKERKERVREFEREMGIRRDAE